MTPILATFVDGGRILEVRSHTDPLLPNGRRMFKLTQTFDHINTDLPPPYNTQIHGAIDVGNFTCGDTVYAPIEGQARTFTDAYGSRNILISSGSWSVLIGHLSDWLIPQGTSHVTRRQPIARVGKTGLGAVCHVHLALREHPAGGGKAIPRDPWPHLEQNQVEDDMRYAKPNLPFFLADLAAGTNLRTAPSLTAEKTTLPADATVGVWSYCGGQEWQGSTQWAVVAYDGNVHYVHASLLGNLRPTVHTPDDGTSAKYDALVAAVKALPVG